MKDRSRGFLPAGAAKGLRADAEILWTTNARTGSAAKRSGRLRTGIRRQRLPICFGGKRLQIKVSVSRGRGARCRDVDKYDRVRSMERRRRGHLHVHAGATGTSGATVQRARGPCRPTGLAAYGTGEVLGRRRFGDTFQGCHLPVHEPDRDRGGFACSECARPSAHRCDDALDGEHTISTWSVLPDGRGSIYTKITVDD